MPDAGDAGDVGGEVIGGRLPLRHRLSAPEPGWTAQADVVVVGSGIAGLTTALEARKAGRVLLVTKTFSTKGRRSGRRVGSPRPSTRRTRPEQHLEDTLVAGAGICDEDAVRVLVTEGPHVCASSSSSAPSSNARRGRASR